MLGLWHWLLDSGCLDSTWGNIQRHISHSSASLILCSKTVAWALEIKLSGIHACGTLSMPIFLQQASYTIVHLPALNYRTITIILTHFPPILFLSLHFISFPSSLLTSGKDGLLLGLEVVEQNGAFLGFLAPVANDDARAVNDFSGVAFAIEYTWGGRRF